MADNTKIEWTDATWNIINGCAVLSAGCTNCYAMRLAGTRMKHIETRKGLTNPSKAGPVWNGMVSFNEAILDQPIKWQRPRKIFVCAHGDLFFENVPDEWIDRVFATMALAPQHIFQVLTKRPARMREYMKHPELTKRIKGQLVPILEALNPRKNHDNLSNAIDVILKGFPHVWLGVSVENQETANERIPLLLDTPAAVRFISAEPLLGPVALTDIEHKPTEFYSALYDPDDLPEHNPVYLDWVIVGGESGKYARPMHPDWAQNIINDCLTAKVPVLFKQWGNWVVAIDRDKQDPKWVADYKGNDPNYRILNLAGGHGFHGERVCLMRRVPKKEAGRAIGHIIFDQYPN